MYFPAHRRCGAVRLNTSLAVPHGRTHSRVLRASIGTVAPAYVKAQLQAVGACRNVSTRTQRKTAHRSATRRGASPITSIATKAVRLAHLFPRADFLLEVLQAVKAGGQVVVPPRARQAST